MSNDIPRDIAPNTANRGTCINHPDGERTTTRRRIGLAFRQPQRHAPYRVTSATFRSSRFGCSTSAVTCLDPVATTAPLVQVRAAGASLRLTWLSPSSFWRTNN